MGATHLSSSSRPPRKRRALALVTGLALVASACSSGDESVARRADTTTDQQAADQAPGDDPARGATLPEGSGADAGSPVAALDFLAHEVQRRAILSMAAQVVGDDDPTGQLAWELQCLWVPDQATLARGALPWPPPDTSSQWQAYVGTTDEYWAEFENACEVYDPATFEAEPDFREALWASEDAHIQACEALLSELEPRLPADADSRFCTYPEDRFIGPETVPDLPTELEAFLSGAEA